ncbi:Z-ring formation inhibitor MciZ [Paenibacillus sp. NEAU-GSW1]|nr:Z-ring formation inhibitor MciZ [Paenibacillus sp. NEAU-GSW1]MUT65558.1 Z-ring formation inhibitor MciZ [Paenibacillus sp. NEAU-GSW1]
MKQYMSAKELRLVGKAWEIRHKLRKLSTVNPSDATLSQLLSSFK